MRRFDELHRLVKISTELTHTDPKAYRGALAVALLAWYETRHPDRTTEAIAAAILQQIGDNEFSDGLQTYTPPTPNAASQAMYHTVPAVFQTWQVPRPPAEGLDSLIRQGGGSSTLHGGRLRRHCRRAARRKPVYRRIGNMV